MLPYLANTHFDFVAEPGLARGDVILKFAGVEMHDIAEVRLGGQYAETAKTLAKAPADFAPGITPDEITPTEPAPTEPAPIELAPAETASGEGVAASDSAASENAQDDQPPSPSDETSS
jgi:hypothetical protein